MKEKTQAQIAAETLMKELPPDTWSNLGAHEAYRQGLEDMVRWIDAQMPQPADPDYEDLQASE